MFCPKCGSQNADDSKFCRGCGATLSGVLALSEGKSLAPQAAANLDEHNELFSSGVRNIVLGFGFLLTSIFLFTMPPSDGILWLLMMIPGFSLLASGISRVVKANGAKAEGKRLNFVQSNSLPSNQPDALPSAQTEYVKPAKLSYETDDLAAQSLSVTESTTRRLKIAGERKTMTLPKE